MSATRRQRAVLNGHSREIDYDLVLEERLRGLPLVGLAALMGHGPSDSRREFFCPACQIRGGESSLDWPTAQVVLVDPSSAPQEAKGWVCHACGTTGTRFTLVRLLLDSPSTIADLAAELKAAGA